MKLCQIFKFSSAFSTYNFLLDKSLFYFKIWSFQECFFSILQVVSKLCRCLESVISHGLKTKQTSSSTLKQMTDLVSNNFGGFLTSAQTSTGPGSSNLVMWNFLKVHLNRHELERYDFEAKSGLSSKANKIVKRIGNYKKGFPPFLNPQSCTLSISKK
jgi:hypothetical protein